MMPVLHTEGPWHWQPQGNRLQLGTPDRGRLVVMDFTRVGMQGAEPRFATGWDGSARGRRGGTMRPASELLALVGELSHPDARLIASAPAMHLALRMIAAGVARLECSGTLVEFCFSGIRYSHNGDWGATLDVIGWPRALAALEGVPA